MITPEVNLQKGNDDVEDATLNDSLIILKKGELLAGMLDKSIVGTSSGGLLHYIWLEYGAEATVKFLTQS